MSALRFLVLLVAWAAVSCQGGREFRNEPGGAPHAVLRGTAYPRAGSLFATHIDGRPTSFWRSHDVFRIPPGPHVVHAAFSDRRETVSYKAEEFAARAGSEYLMEREREPGAVSPLAVTPHPETRHSWIIHDRRDRMVIRQGRAGEKGEIVAEAPKVEAVFGCASAEEAVAAYRKKGP